MASAYGLPEDEPEKRVEQFVDRVDRELRPEGYRMAGTFVPGSSVASGVAGFRLVRSNAWGDHLWVDDLLAAGFGAEAEFAQLLVFLGSEARKLGVLQIHVDVSQKPEAVGASGSQEADIIDSSPSRSWVFDRNRAVFHGLQEVGSRFAIEVADTGAKGRVST